MVIKLIVEVSVGVGKPAPGVSINIVKVTDDDIDILHDLAILLTKQIGEVVVDASKLLLLAIMKCLIKQLMRKSFTKEILLHHG